VRQRAVPDEVLGRVGGVYRIAIAGGMVVGTPIGGLLARSHGITAPFWFAFMGSAILVTILCASSSTSWTRATSGQWHGRSASPGAGWSRLQQPAITIAPRSGSTIARPCPMHRPPRRSSMPAT
jgi:MFS family permease